MPFFSVPVIHIKDQKSWFAYCFSFVMVVNLQTLNKKKTEKTNVCCMTYTHIWVHKYKR